MGRVVARLAGGLALGGLARAVPALGLTGTASVVGAAGQVVAACAVAVLTNIGVIGLPGAAVLFAACGPVFAVLGAPLEMIALLIPVFTLPDILDTSANVGADLSVTAIVTRRARQKEENAGFGDKRMEGVA